MRIQSLALKNIGPFIEADMTFFDDEHAKPPVVLFTGENGTGKSIILDAIRGMFGQDYCKLPRDIRRKKAKVDSAVSMTLMVEDNGPQWHKLTSRTFTDNSIESSWSPLLTRPVLVKNNGESCPNWVVDYWASNFTNGATYKVNELKNPEHNKFLLGSLQGDRVKSDITQLICHFDYMRDSRDTQERESANQLYEMLQKMVSASLLDGGYLSHVSRANLEPIIIQNGQPVGLENLSGGNLYLIQNLTGLLGKMYAVHYLRKTPLEELGQTPGLLLIDEAENQLHPKWQKRFIATILKFFPNLQIIATTHSPFIIASVANARLFVCKARADHCVVEDVTGQYDNKPVDEILMSPLFEETQPFNEEITDLIKQREAAIKEGDAKQRERIETRLKAINPEHFSYLGMDRLLEELKGGGNAP